MSADDRRLLGAPVVRVWADRKVDLDASGVLFLCPAMLLAIIASEIYRFLRPAGEPNEGLEIFSSADAILRVCRRCES